MLGTLTHMMNRYIISLMLAFSLLIGCSGIKTYQNTPYKNLHIKTETDSGSMFSTVRAAVDIYRVGPDCKTEYEGTVKLEKPSIDVGVPSGHLSYLVFVFASSGFLSNSSGTITYNTLLKPRVGYNYDIKVSYIDDIYNVVVWEIHPGKKKRSEIELIDLNACDSF